LPRILPGLLGRPSHGRCGRTGEADPAPVQLDVPESFERFCRRCYHDLVALSAGLLGDALGVAGRLDVQGARVRRLPGQRPLPRCQRRRPRSGVSPAAVGRAKVGLPSGDGQLSVSAGLIEAGPVGEHR
jgi:hypothetical protein